MKKNHFIKKLEKLHVCKEAVEWAKEYPNLQKAWDACDRGDWMLWLVGKLSGSPESNKRKKLVLAACDCVEKSLPYSGSNREMIIKCLKITRLWAKGEATIKQVGISADAVYAAANAAANAAAYAAADLSLIHI